MISKPAALYYHPESIGSDDGARCGICRFYTSRACKIVEGDIDPDVGICGLYVKNDYQISKAEAGYATNGPTHCASCEYMITRKLFGQSRCMKVDGLIEGRGCCNLWEHE